MAALLAILLAVGCKRRVALAPRPSAAPAASGYVIQVGVFASRDNAARLTQRLQAQKLNAFFFAHESGYFKVQVGGFADRTEAERAARRLLRQGAVDEYFVVARREAPSPSTAPPSGDAAAALRRDLAETARSFLDFPYAWGGASAEEGFDCSGLATAVYRLNGLSLPRALGEQWESGRSVDRDDLRQGDLVFFATQARGVVSHVGIYVGDGLFIHAPGRDKKVRRESLANPYYATRFVGARRHI